jgi:hypothetical protein
MLRKSSMFMMVLLVAASLVGISSAVYHQPEVASAQPQPQQPQQSPQQGQLQSPSTAASPTLGKRLTSPQGMQQQQQSNVGTLVQIQQDKELVNRLFPYIIQKIDGKTLLQKIDGNLLAQKVFPYLDLNVVLTQRPGQIGSIKVGMFASGGGAWGKASCAPGETAVSAGFTHEAKGDLSVFSMRRQDPNSNAWDITTSFDDTGKVLTYAECLKVELALRGAQQPQQQSSPPPGGPPLQPPPNLR